MTNTIYLCNEVYILSRFVDAVLRYGNMKSLQEKHIREIIDYLFDISCKMANTKFMYSYAEESGLDINVAFKELYMDYAQVKCNLDGLRGWLEGYVDGDSNG